MRFPLRRLPWLGLLLLSSAAALGAQAKAPAPAPSQEVELPEALRDKAFTLSIQACLMKDADTVAWASEGIRSTVPGTSVGFKLVGTNVVIVVQLTPYDDGKGSILLVTQGQVWIKKAPGEVVYRTNLDSLNVRYGESFYYYPFGLGDKAAPPLKVTISINRYESAEGRILRAKALKDPTGSGALPLTDRTAQTQPPAGSSVSGAAAPPPYLPLPPAGPKK